MNTPIKLTLVAAALLPAFASAAVIYSNDFSTSTSGITAVNSTTLTVATDANFGTGEKVMTLTNSSAVSRASVAFQAVTLNVGDRLTLTLDAKFTGTAQTAAFRRLGLGLYNGSTLDGYAGLVGYSSGDSTFVIRGYDSPTNSFSATTAVANDAGTTSASGTAGTLGNSLTYVHRDTTFSILKTSTGLDITFSGYNTGGTLMTMTWSTIGSYTDTFDHADFSTWGTNGLNFNVDNVAVTYTAVPEPSTYALTGAGALAAVAFVRRRRKRA